MVVDKNINDKSKVNCIIHYTCILQKWGRRGYEIYLMGRVFASDLDLENVRVYTRTRMIHD